MSVLKKKGHTASHARCAGLCDDVNCILVLTNPLGEQLLNVLVPRRLQQLDLHTHLFYLL